ncbi:MAG: hypothetical protein ABEJ60_01675 [Halodesulfurarchaeum sp.]
MSVRQTGSTWNRVDDYSVGKGFAEWPRPSGRDGEDAIAVGDAPGEGSPVEHATTALDGDGTGSSRLAAVAAAVSPETYWDLIISSAARADGFDLSGIERDGRTVVVRGSVPTHSLWSVHAELLGLD